ncbi:MAG: hypothetical protein KJO79_06275, partial [Verrucomicrobiae bacterium]|nr:hypothetical protein [Verrucomicrobiae bacterium]NNJ86768.1 hypothetical protein [Akkermansiaceae bacterium]
MKPRNIHPFRSAVISTLLALLSASSLVTAATLSIKVDSTKSSDSEPEVTISSHQCDGLGALQFTLSYDSSVLEPTSVEAGSELSNGLIEFEIQEAGQLRVAMISSEPVKTTGELLKIIFKRTGSDTASSELNITVPIAWEFENNTEMLVNSEGGSLELTKPSLIPSNLIPDHLKLPMIIGAAVLVLLVLVIAITKKKKPKPAADKGGSFCPECGGTHPSGAKFCPHCG